MNIDQHLDMGLRDGFAVSKRLYEITVQALMRSDFMVEQSSKLVMP